MRNQGYIITFSMLICIFAFFGFSGNQSCGPITRSQLREMVTQLGYTVTDIVKDAGKEKFSISITKEGLDIPVAAEISGNGQYIWLTVNLGPAKPADGTRSFALLKQVAITQPSHFYVTESGTQMMGLAVENRGISNAILRERFESISSRVGESKAIWQ